MIQLTNTQIKQLTAEVFSELYVSNDIDLLALAELLKILSEAAEKGNALRWFQEMELNKDKFQGQNFLECISLFKKRYDIYLSQTCIKKINEELQKNPEQAFDLFYQYCAESLCYFEQAVAYSLYQEAFPFADAQKILQQKIKNYHFEMLNSNWLSVKKYFEEIANNQKIPNELRAEANLLMAEVCIYWDSPTDPNAYLAQASALDKTNERIILVKGAYLSKCQSFESARQLIFPMVQITKNKANVYVVIGDSYLDEFKYQEGLEWYQNAFNIGFWKATVYSKILSAKMTSIEQEEIESYIKTVSIISPDTPYQVEHYTILRDVAFLYSQKKQYDISLSYYARAIALRPELKVARLDEAVVIYYSKNIELALQKISELLHQFPDYADAWWWNAYIQEQTKNILKAEESYLKYAMLRPEKAAITLSNLAEMFKAEQNYVLAEKYYKMSFEINPDITSLINLKSVYELQGNDEMVIAVSEKIIASKPQENNFNEYNLVGIYFYNKKNYEKAIEYYLKAISLKEKDEILLDNLGLAYQDTGMEAEAEETFLKATVYAKNGGANNRLGVFYFTKSLKVNEPERTTLLTKSIQFYDAAIALEATNDIYFQNKAYSYQFLNNLDLAKENYLTAIKMNPKNEFSTNSVGVLFYQEGEHEKSLEYYKQAIEINPQNIIYYQNISLSLKLLGRYDEAATYLETALTLKKDNTLINELSDIYKLAGNEQKYQEIQNLYINNVGWHSN